MKQQLIKDSEITYKQVLRKLEKLTEKSNKQAILITELRSDKRKCLRRVGELTLSREKTRDRNERLTNKNKGLSCKLKAKHHHYTVLMIELGVLLRMFTNCSYRSISKILSLLKGHLSLEDLTIPCANTIQKWVSKVGLNSLKNLYATYLEGKIGIVIDERIMIGNSKMLLILFTSAFKEKVDAALDFSAVRIAYLGYSTSWTAAK